MISIYIISFTISLILFAVLAHLYKNHTSVYYVALFIAIIFYSFGNLMVSVAQNESEAIMATKFLYLAACFTPFFSFLCISELTKTKVPFHIKAIFFTCSCIVVALVSTIGFLPLYYKSVSIVKWHGITCLIKEYGPTHLFYPIYLILISIASLILIFISLKKRRQISYITSITLFVVLIISLTAYFFERLTHLQIELLPLAFNCEQIGILFLLRRIHLYDVSCSTTSMMLESDAYGFVVFNSKGKFMGCEGAASKWFPEVNLLYVDSGIPQTAIETSDFLNQIDTWLKENKNEEQAYFERDEKIIEINFSENKFTHEKHLYLIALRDDTKQQNLNRLIKDYNSNLEKRVNEKTSKIKSIQDDIIVSMASIVENRDGNTGGHIKRTSDVMRIFVPKLMETNKFSNLTPEIAACLTKAAPLHDFGKIGVPDKILNKPGKFTDDEYEIMKTHSEKGAVIVSQILNNSDDNVFIKIAVNVAHYHHEKWNGRGYPAGLKENQIPFEARVMALADVFDALVSKRVYKDQFSYDTAFKIIEESCGEHFDPDLCKEFMACRPELEALYNSYND